MPRFALPSLRPRSIPLLPEITWRAKQKPLWPAIVLFLLALVPQFLPIAFFTVLALYFLLFAVAWAFGARKRLPSDVWSLILPFVFICFLGLLGARDRDAYAVAKDVWYVLNPALALIVGYALMIASKDLYRFLRVVVYAAIATATIHLTRFAFYPDLLLQSAVEIRLTAGRGYFIVVLACVIVITSWVLKSAVFAKGSWIPRAAVVICGTSAILAYSRTLWLAAFILLTAGLGLFDGRRLKKSLVGATLLAILALVSLSFVEVPAVTRESSVLEKFLFSAQEMQIGDYRSLEEINKRWRGYETGRALIAYRQANWLEKIIGRGFGEDIDLGIYMRLGEEKIRYAPILHNGFAYLLVKTGPLGVLSFLALVSYLFWCGVVGTRDPSADKKLAARTLIGLAVIFLLSTAVVSGPFNKSVFVSALLLTGGLVAYLRSVAFRGEEGH